MKYTPFFCRISKLGKSPLFRRKKKSFNFSLKRTHKLLKLRQQYKKYICYYIKPFVDYTSKKYSVGSSSNIWSIFSNHLVLGVKKLNTQKLENHSNAQETRHASYWVTRDHYKSIDVVSDCSRNLEEKEGNSYFKVVVQYDVWNCNGISSGDYHLVLKPSVVFQSKKVNFFLFCMLFAICGTLNF